MTHFKVNVNCIYVEVFPLDSGAKSAVREKKKTLKKHWFSLFTCMDGEADIDPMTLS